MAYKPILVTAELAAYHLHRLGVRKVSGATIRQWARRGYIRTHRGGYARYDLREVEKHARQKGYLTNGE